MKRAHTARTTPSRLTATSWIASSALLSLSVAQAAEITRWNPGNVTTEIPPFILGETYNSFVYTDETKTVTNGSIIWVEGDVQAPGAKVVTDGDPADDPESCIMTAGFNPEDGTTKQCDDPFQTSKRYKRANRVADEAVDLVFDVDPGVHPVDPVYRILEKYENLTGVRLSAFTIELGTGTGAAFTPSSADDGIGFSSRTGTVWDADNPTLTGQTDPNSLDADFAFGLFGDADTNQNQEFDGYYDPFNRARFLLAAREDSIETTGITTNITGLYDGDVGSWLAKSQVPVAFLFDNDGDPTTDARVIADWNGSIWQTYRLETDPIAVAANLSPGAIDNGDGTVTPVPVDLATIEDWIPDPAFTVGPIEDFGNVNFNMHVNVHGYQGNTVTLRVTSVADDVNTGTPWNDVLPWTSDVAITKLEVPEEVELDDSEHNKFGKTSRKSKESMNTLRVRVQVKNKGPDEVVTGEVFVRAVNEDGTVGARFTGEILNLKPERRQSFVFDWPGPFVPGDTTWEASVEAFAAFDPNTDNNEATATTEVEVEDDDRMKHHYRMKHH